MKTLIRPIFIFLILSTMLSCKEYRTRVINKVHSDGSLERSIIVETNISEKFEPLACQVPMDSTWSLETEMTPGENDTLWTYTAKKHFASTEELTMAYKEKESSNDHLQRSATFEKRFLWFHTIYYFEEEVKALLDIVDPGQENYMTEDELAHHMLPEPIKSQLKTGADSLYYRALADSMEYHYEQYFFECLFKQWLSNLRTEVLEAAPDSEAADLLESLEAETGWQAMFGIIDSDMDEDSAMVALLGKEFVEAYSREIDTAMNRLEEQVDHYLAAEDYLMEIRMPGRVVSTNGFMDPEGDASVLWTVSGDYFIARDYRMWVESRTMNYWTWVLSGLFVLFVLIGLLRSRRPD